MRRNFALTWYNRTIEYSICRERREGTSLPFLEGVSFPQDTDDGPRVQSAATRGQVPVTKSIFVPLDMGFHQDNPIVHRLYNHTGGKAYNSTSVRPFSGSRWKGFPIGCSLALFEITQQIVNACAIEFKNNWANARLAKGTSTFRNSFPYDWRLEGTKFGVSDTALPEVVICLGY